MSGYSREYYLKNREKIKSNQRDYYSVYRDEIIKKRKEYRIINKQAISKYKKEYYANNKDYICRRVYCECGAYVGRRVINTHFKSLKHKYWESIKAFILS